MEGTAIALLAASGVILLALGVLLGRLLARGPVAPPPDLGSLSATLALLQEAARSHAQQLQELGRSVREIALTTGQLQTRLQTSEERHGQLSAGLEKLNLVVGELRSGLAAIHRQQDQTAGRLDHLQQALAAAQQTLSELRRYDEEARRQQEELGRFVARLDAILTGSASRGAAGEHILETFLEQLPAEFKVFDLPIRNRRVEFAFRLPNGKHVPVDSKWVGARQLTELDETASAEARRELEQLLDQRVEEVRAYLDPDLTLGFAVIAVPDAVYRWTQRRHAHALAKGVIVISYSMAIPYFLTLLHLALRFLRDEETMRISQLAHQLEQALQAIQQELNGRYAKGLTMLQNSRDALAEQTARALGTLRQLQALGQPGGPAALAERNEDEAGAQSE
jgi:DNA recombination protein RmuC